MLSEEAPSFLPDTSAILPLLVALFGLRVLENNKLEWISELKRKSEPGD